MVSCAFAVIERRDLGLTGILFCRVSKWERDRHEENKQVYKKMIIMMNHRNSGKVR